MIFKMKQMFMHVMLNNYFDSYCQNAIGFLAENPKANSLHELSYVYVKTHKCIPNIQKMKIKKNTYGIRTLNLPMKKTWLSSVRITLTIPPPVLPLCVLIAYAY